MIREWFEQQVERARVNVEFAKLRLSNVTREQYRRGWEDGYRRGREHERDGLPDVVDMPQGVADHPQVEVDGIEIDEGIRDLLVALWKLGLETQFSCQGDRDWFTPHQPFSGNCAAHVVFADIADAYKFLTKTIELLGQFPHHEGGLILKTMTPWYPDTRVRASVEFLPALLPRITELWTEFETTVPPAADD